MDPLPFGGEPAIAGTTRHNVHPAVGDILPRPDSILEAMGVPGHERGPARIRDLVDGSLSILRNLAHPRGVLESVSKEEFRRVYQGEGLNEAESPLEEIFPQATHLALFAVTVGGEVSGKIEELFGQKDFSLGYVLDAAASEAVESTADRLQARFESLVRAPGSGPHAVLRYSPGYCGWHLSGQKRLFETLRPQEIGIELGDSFLMQPLKSVSGVLVAGRREIHRFRNVYDFCELCATKTCRDRLKRLFQTDEE